VFGLAYHLMNVLAVLIFELESLLFQAVQVQVFQLQNSLSVLGWSSAPYNFN